jgi:serine/threonine-protein kinase
MESLHGKLLGRYEIVAEVGRGAMGAVYKARDPKIDRFVAIKTILLHQSVVQEQQEFRRRFFVEAQAAGRLLHPGIVTVFDVGEDPQTSDPYIVMEYIEGHTLRELLASNGKKLPLEEALRIAQEVAEALDYAHSQGVVHRDIKPANILITKQGQAKISDFGIAQLDLTQMTLPGRVLGTPAYMSPEQLEGERVDGRSDLFSLGAILYTCVTGYRPFQGNSATTVCFKVANRDPLPATALAPETPHELDAIIERALAKTPAERYQRGQDFADDLRKLREKRPAHKSQMWFSPPAGRRAWLDGKPPAEAPLQAISSSRMKSPPVPPQKKSMQGVKLPATPPQKSSTFGFVFSSWQAQTAIGIPLFAAAMIVSLFAWHEIRDQRTSPKTSAQGGNQMGAALQVQTPVPATGSAADSVVALQTPANSQTDRIPDIDAEPTAAFDDSAPKSRVSHLYASTNSATAPKESSADESSAANRSTEVGNRPASTKAKSKSVAATAAPKSAPKGPTTVAASKQPPKQLQVSQPAISASAAVADSNLEIRIDNRFADASLKVWVDETLAYAHPLHDGHKKRLILLGGGAKDAVTIPVSAGKHALRIEVRSAAEQYDETKTVDGEFLTGGGLSLSVTFDKHSKDMRLALGNE